MLFGVFFRAEVSQSVMLFNITWLDIDDFNTHAIEINQALKMSQKTYQLMCSYFISTVSCYLHHMLPCSGCECVSNETDFV